MVFVLVGCDVLHRERGSCEVVDANDHVAAKPKLVLPLALGLLVAGSVHPHAGGLVARLVAMPGTEPDVLEGFVLARDFKGAVWELSFFRFGTGRFRVALRLDLAVRRSDAQRTGSGQSWIKLACVCQAVPST
jgi:hypothetical protein